MFRLCLFPQRKIEAVLFFILPFQFAGIREQVLKDTAAQDPVFIRFVVQYSYSVLFELPSNGSMQSEPE